MKNHLSRYAFAVAAFASRAYAVGSLSECMSGEDADIKDISTNNWSASYELTLDPGDSCYHVTFSQSYAWWASSEQITVKTQNYVHPVGSQDECQPD